MILLHILQCIDPLGRRRLHIPLGACQRREFSEGGGDLWKRCAVVLLVLFPVKNLYNAIRSERVRWIALFVSPLFAYVLNRFSINWPFLLVARYLVAACGITDPVAAVTLYVGGRPWRLPCVHALNKRFGWV